MHGPVDSSGDQATAVADRLRSITMTGQQRLPFRDYKTILRLSLETALAELGQNATAADQDALLASLGRVAPHPEAPLSLERLRARYRLAIIGNTDVHGIVRQAVPSEIWRQIFCVMGAVAVGVSVWLRLAASVNVAQPRRS